jgi:hypothetical protein
MTDILQHMRGQARRLGQTEVVEKPPLYLPWTQRVLNPFPLASSGGNWGDSGQPWAVNVLAFYCSVFVATTNSATNFWTVALIDTAGTTLASFTTAAIAANTYARFAPAISVQPGTSNIALAIKCTATLNPGAIYIFPAVALLRAG